MFGADSNLYRNYVASRSNAVLPWSLSIVDCFFLKSAFRALVANDDPLTFSLISDDGDRRIEHIRDAYDLYRIDSEAYGIETVLLHEASGALCYWDVHERFVVVSGSDGFRSVACPYPPDIERHQYVEAMQYLEESETPESPGRIFDFVKGR